MSRAALVDLILIAFLTLLWGSAFAFIEVALPAFSPAMIAFLRILVAAIAVGLWAIFTGPGLPREPGHWARCLALGLFGFALPFTLVPYGQEYVNSATAAILMAFSPISTLILAHFFTQDEKMTVRRLIAVSLGFLGVVVLFGGALDARSMGVGTAALLGAAFSYAIAGLIMKSLYRYSDISSSAGSLVMATLWCVPALALRSDFSRLRTVFSADPVALLSIFILALGPTALATLMVLIIVRRRGATFAATSNYGVPVAGVLIGALFLKEPIGWNILATLGLILAAVWLARPQPNKAA